MLLCDKKQAETLDGSKTYGDLRHKLLRVLLWDLVLSG